jgi:hypothetical protein
MISYSSAMGALENDEARMTNVELMTNSKSTNTGDRCQAHFFVICSFGLPSSFVIRHSSFWFRHLFYESILPRAECLIFSDKICCDLLEARLLASKFFMIVLGGTAALHAYRVWGAVIF